jgi:16S rRNA (guanine966-N2)-methyltransferase
MRIIGGRFRGKRLHSPTDQSIRPTGDRVRESLFNILEHQGLIRGARFLDLFCGTGAVGLEAYSRGAADVWLMDQDIGLAAHNVDAFDRPQNVRLCHQQALTKEKPPLQFDVIFLDPPYRKGLVEPTLSALADGWLAPSSWVVVELSSKDDFEAPADFFLRQDRRYGRTKMFFLGVQEAG